MTEVVCSLGPVERIADAAPVVADAIVDALGAWGGPLPHLDTWHHTALGRLTGDRQAG